MNLADIYMFFGLQPNGNNQKLPNLKSDSRQIKPGDVFVAVAGSKYDGRNYIDQALKNGASAVLTQDDIPDLKSKLPELAAFFYGWPSESMQIIGITGTNGKTSITNYIAQILASVNINCGIMGTLGNGWIGNLQPSGLTTSDCCTIQSQLANFSKNNTKYVAMEVSSHALDQQRLDFVKFSTAVFTNLTQDHLDYHTDMEEYFAAKAKLFGNFLPQHRVINLDDEYGARLLRMFPSLSYSLENPRADVHMVGNKVITPWGEGILDNPLLGKFNLSNILACISVCGAHGIPLDAILAAVRNLQPVPGRMQKIAAKQGPLVVVDYAHTPDALAKALQALQAYNTGNLYCVFGCGGDRDRTKRPLMLEAALAYSDQVVITQDNPRTEDPQQILSDILNGKNRGNKVAVIQDRLQAIQQTIMQADFEDVILVAGKGHEDYQIIGEQRLPFSDAQVAHQALNNWGSHG